VELEGKSVTIVGDQFALETMLSNLLNNASKYTPAEGKINVRIDELEDEICLTVEDNGPGIPPQERKAVFERFYRSNKIDDSRDTPGCGLGLTIVNHITELHNARVTLEDSSFASGCAFKIHFKK